MAILTSSQIGKMYDQYSDIDITFTKDIVSATMLMQKEIYLRFGGQQRKCLLYSTSLKKARIIINTGDNLIARIRESGELVSLRLSFGIPGKKEAISFFINARVNGYNSYSDSESDLNYAYLTFTQRPPDDLIIIIGKLLDVNINFKKRKDFRIVLNQDNFADLGLYNRELQLIIENIPRKTLIADISASGLKAIGVKTIKFHINKSVTAKFHNISGTNWEIQGKVLRVDPFTSRNDIGIIAIEFKQETIPVSFKMQIEQFLQLHKESLQAEPGQLNGGA